jgi:hypothetical protein
VISALTCEELANGRAAEVLPLCELLGEGCDRAPSCGGPALSADLTSQLLTWTDTSTLDTARDTLRRLEDIDSVLVSAQDRRGLFASVYLPITTKAIDQIESGAYPDVAWAENMVIDFATIYFDNLRADLTASPMTTAWGRYYGLTRDCSASSVRVAGVGINTHLVQDLPRALVYAGSEPRHEEDFMRWGDDLVVMTDTVIEDLAVKWSADAADFLGGFFIGDYVDAAYGPLTTSEFLFQSVRAKAWFVRGWLGSPSSAGFAEVEMNTSWGNVDGAMATLDALGIL